MDFQSPVATKDELWRLQEDIKELFTAQGQHSERIMRLEKRRDEDMRVKNVWAPVSSFPGSLGNGTQQETGLNPAAEAFRNFDADTQSGSINNLPLDQDDERRRGTSRANSVRFDESANNHYGSTSRQSVELLPLRTGSGFGGHPLSERSLSHRSDGKGSLSGLSMRANSFGLEQSRLLGSTTNSPKTAGNPPPAFYVLGPVPALIRCWLTEAFSNDSLLYAAVCSGSYASCIGISLIRRCGLEDEIFEENGVKKIKLPIYLTEATIHQPSSRSPSPAPQVPTLHSKFLIVEAPAEGGAVQVVIGSDILRAYNADMLLSQDRMMIYDEERNWLVVPLVRPENEAAYKGLITMASPRDALGGPRNMANGPTAAASLAAGVIGRPIRETPMAETSMRAERLASAVSEPDDPQGVDRASEADESDSTEASAAQHLEDSRSTTGSDKSFTTPTPTSRSNSGVWGNSWRSSPNSHGETGKSASGYSRAGAARGMKVLRAGKSMASSSRTVSGSTIPGVENVPNGGSSRRTTMAKADVVKVGVKHLEPASQPTKSNPIGQASAFGWLNARHA